jgi:hypothetical protein
LVSTEPWASSTRTGIVLGGESSTCSSWRRRSPARARQLDRNLRSSWTSGTWGTFCCETGPRVYWNGAAALVGRRPGGSFATMPPPSAARRAPGARALYSRFSTTAFQA